jgi:hypothetical protein
MRKLLVHEFMSLDGVMQAPGGKDEDRDGGFEHGGWTVPCWDDGIGDVVYLPLSLLVSLLPERRRWRGGGKAGSGGGYRSPNWQRLRDGLLGSTGHV